MERASPPSPSQWSAFLALAFLAAPLLLEAPSSIICLPYPYGWVVPKLIEAGAIVLIGVWMFRQRWLPRAELTIVFGALFVMQAALSALWVVDNVGVIGSRGVALGGGHLFKFLHHAVAAFVLYAAIRTRANLELVLCGWVLISFLSAVLTIAEIWFPGWKLEYALVGRRIEFLTESWEGIRGEYHRANGPLGHPNYQGFFFAVSLLLHPFLWDRFRAGRFRVVLVIMTMTILYALMLCYVRLGIIGLVVGGLWLVIRGGRRHRLTVVALGAGAVVAVAFMPSAWVQRMIDPQHLWGSRSIAMRQEQVAETLDVAKDHALLGVGYGGYGDTFHHEASAAVINSVLTTTGWWSGWRVDYSTVAFGAHNTYLEVLVELGILGLLLLAAAAFSLWRGLTRAATANAGDRTAWGLGRAFEAMTLSLAVMFIFIHAQDQRVAWMLVGAGAAYVRLSDAGQMQPTSLGLGPRTVRAAVFSVYAVLAFVVVMALISSAPESPAG